jgi:hypothetical protein
MIAVCLAGTYCFAVMHKLEIDASFAQTVTTVIAFLFGASRMGQMIAGSVSNVSVDSAKTPPSPPAAPPPAAGVPDPAATPATSVHVETKS